MTSQWTTIQTFRQFGRWGLPLASSEARKQNIELGYKLAFDPAFEKYLNREAFLASGLAQSLPNIMTQQAVETFEGALDASSLVFAHSLLDGTVHDYCRLCAMIAPRDFLPFVGEKKLALNEIEGQSFENLLGNLIEVYLTNLEKESLLRKADFLFQICRPPSGFAPMEGYTFSRSRLADLDALRHRIVHTVGPLTRIPNSEDDFEFLWKTGNFLFCLVNNKYDVKIDPRYIIELWTQNRNTKIGS